MSMRVDWSLRTRFLLAVSVLVIVLCGAFAAAVHECIELLEDEMLNHTLVREMQEFKRASRRSRSLRRPAAGGLRGFHRPQCLGSGCVAAGGGRSVQRSARGRRDQGRVYYVAVDDLGPTRLYLLLDTERVELLEGDVVGTAVLVGLVALCLAAVLGFAMSRAVMRPVTQLANDVAHLDPARRNERLRNRLRESRGGHHCGRV